MLRTDTDPGAKLREELSIVIEEVILRWSEMVAEIFQVTRACAECDKTPAYMLRVVGDVSREGKAQATKYACKRHLTLIIDESEGSVVVRKMK